MPYELLAAYQDAKSASSRQCFDQALWHYYHALEYDPQNPYLRAEVAGVQEKLGLRLDALDTCQQALTLDGQTSETYNKRLWTQWTHHALRYLFKPRCYRDTFGLRHRNAAILGTSELTVAQWFRNDGYYRKNERQRIRERLRPTLVDRYWPAAIDFALRDRGNGAAPRNKDTIREKSREWLGDHLTLDENDQEASEAKKRLIRVVFQRACSQELFRLARDDQFARFSSFSGLEWIGRLARLLCPLASPERVHLRRSATRSALRISQNTWAPLRLSWACALAEKAHVMQNLRHPQGVRKPREWRGRAYDRKGKISWDMSAQKLHGEVEKCLKWRPWRFPWLAHEWQDHYNAACAYAVLMHRGDEVNAPSENEDLTKLAMRELEKAVKYSESGFITVERAWMTVEDPDLAILRSQPRFMDFQHTAYPRSAPSGPYLQNFLVPLMQEYEKRLLRSVAKEMESVWRQRGGSLTEDIHKISEWLQGEHETWVRLERVIADHGRHWPDRIQLIQTVQENATITSMSMEFPPPMFQIDALVGGAPGNAVDKLMDTLDKDVTGQQAISPIEASHEWYKALSDADAIGMTTIYGKDFRSLCSHFAATWLRFGNCIESLTDEGSVREALKDEESFRKALRSVPLPERRPWRNSDQITLLVPSE
ncbi:hypothetical protein [Streptomyces sp. ME19-01-6]|uniref:hypothetical protein n=1 Tax=Streptomyces sp. ME19-01-6 TaxID=3028686 RepID=UPI0029BB1183|nr:hypothetical protein [Streptomyces sp. ME19-01-6]MDX3224490.1 hypothetical protein [Streptomyces sp. ME19-01-6]